MRQWIYLVLTALLPILVGYGVVAETDVSLWLALAAAILGAGGTALAASHTPKDD
ncbi:phage holin [Gordonia sihwensis]|uniref:phage holin n=1 Tax=Gordonia sihwensis TaxID=173559 RepID=UPI003FD8BF15